MRNEEMKSMNSLLFSSFFFYFCTGQQQQICTSPVYNGSIGVTIRGPCPSSQVLAPVGSTKTFECSYDYSGKVHVPFWNITGHEPLVLDHNDANLTVTTNSEVRPRETKLFVKILKQYLTNPLDVQCGLCNTANPTVNCFIAPQPTVISLPVQVISFGK